MNHTYPMAAPGATPHHWMRGLMAVLIGACVATVTFTPGAGRWVLLLCYSGVGALILHIARRMDHITFDIDGRSLHVRGDLFSTAIPLSAIDAKQARLANPDVEQTLAPFIRTGGAALPGYVTGWYRLRNSEKAFVCLTDKSKAVYLPTTLGYSLLLSPADPQAFLDAVCAG